MEWSELAYHDANKVLDRYLGTNGEDGTGDGLAANIDLLGRQRDEAKQENKRLREALKDAAMSLETLSMSGGRDHPISDLVDVRGYASSRAWVARTALQEADGGGN